MGQGVAVQVLERSRQRQADAHAFLERQPAVKKQVALERAWRVVVCFDLTAGGLVVSQFHHVKKTVFGAPYMQNVHLAVVQSRDRLEFEDTLKLAFKRAVVIKGLAMNNFHGAKRASHTAGQPDFPIRPPTDTAKQCMVWHVRRG